MFRRIPAAIAGVASLLASLSILGAAAVPREAYFGDLHIHTVYSFDAFLGSVRTTPDDAYRFAKGEAIDHPAGTKLRLSGPPLDFLMVSDHARWLGVFAAQLDPKGPTAGHPDHGELLPQRGTSLDGIIRRLRQIDAEGHDFLEPPVAMYAWDKIISAAERHNAPGRFTTFIGYEYTPSPGSRHLHRNVVFRSGDVPDRPFSSTDSENPANLWAWLDELRSQGIDSLAIPHNMNQSDGLAFQTTTFDGKVIDREYAATRLRNEPIAEISQIKGTSETHPLLSPNDEWADFQIVRYYLNRTENKNPISVFKGGYWRDALKTGLAFEQQLRVNPYQLGSIGSSDTHVSAGPFEEDSYFSGGRNTPEARGSAFPKDQGSWEDYWTPRQATHGTGGLAAVWATENTRDALFDAMRQRETFATSGVRMRVRLFGGFALDPNIADAIDPVARGYATGVPMGGVLAPEQQPPSFFIWAVRDPNAGWLQRVQIVKGWLDGGETFEAVYDVACSDGLEPDPETHRCPDNGATVNLSDCSVSRNMGDVELTSVWRDPDYQPDERAFYYARVLENPSCRWSTWDAIRSGIEPNPDLPAVHQERAWSSPIWITPEA